MTNLIRSLFVPVAVLVLLGGCSVDFWTGRNIDIDSTGLDTLIGKPVTEVSSVLGVSPEIDETGRIHAYAYGSTCELEVGTDESGRVTEILTLRHEWDYEPGLAFGALGALVTEDPVGRSMRSCSEMIVLLGGKCDRMGPVSVPGTTDACFPEEEGS